MCLIGTDNPNLPGRWGDGRRDGSCALAGQSSLDCETHPTFSRGQRRKSCGILPTEKGQRSVPTSGPQSIVYRQPARMFTQKPAKRMQMDNHACLGMRPPFVRGPLAHPAALCRFTGGAPEALRESGDPCGIDLRQDNMNRRFGGFFLSPSFPSRARISTGCASRVASVTLEPCSL
jgi:hypothetical protein